MGLRLLPASATFPTGEALQNVDPEGLREGECVSLVASKGETLGIDLTAHLLRNIEWSPFGGSRLSGRCLHSHERAQAVEVLRRRVSGEDGGLHNSRFIFKQQRQAVAVSFP